MLSLVPKIQHFPHMVDLEGGGGGAGGGWVHGELGEMDIWEESSWKKLNFSPLSLTPALLAFCERYQSTKIINIYHTYFFSVVTYYLFTSKRFTQLFYFFDNQACLGDNNVMCVVSFFSYWPDI